RSLLRRVAGQKVLWAAGFALFALAASSEALAQRAGWSPALFRTYYLAGGVLTVAYLGAGSAWLLLPNRVRDALLGALAVATAATGLSRTGNTSLVYVGERLGIALMFCGFTLMSPARRPARAAEPAPRAAVVAR